MTRAGCAAMSSARSPPAKIVDLACCPVSVFASSLSDGLRLRCDCSTRAAPRAHFCLSPHCLPRLPSLLTCSTSLAMGKCERFANCADVSKARTLHIAFLNCDEPGEETKRKHGGFDDIMHSLLEPVLSEAQDEIALVVDGYDVVQAMEYPTDLEPLDAIIISGSCALACTQSALTLQSKRMRTKTCRGFARSSTSSDRSIASMHRSA